MRFAGRCGFCCAKSVPVQLTIIDVRDLKHSRVGLNMNSRIFLILKLKQFGKIWFLISKTTNKQNKTHVSWPTWPISPGTAQARRRPNWKQSTLVSKGR